MSAALLQSGYLMESRIVTGLAKAGYFVEPNQRIADSKTGKAREIDIVAELWDYNPEMLKEHKLSVSVKFICAAKNNPNPVVLLTNLPFSPGLPVWESLREGCTGLFSSQHTDLRFYEFLAGDEKAYSQYCSFRPKKDNKSEWVAFHPDDFYDDLEKIVAYCDEEIQFVNDLSDNFHRLHLYFPVVILGGDLYVSHQGARPLSLKKVNMGYYMHFGLKDKKPSQALIAFVTEKHLLKFFEAVNDIARFLERQFIESTHTTKEGTTKKSRRR